MKWISAFFKYKIFTGKNSIKNNIIHYKTKFYAAQNMENCTWGP